MAYIDVCIERVSIENSLLMVSFHTCRIVPDLDEDSPSSKSDDSPDQEDGPTSITSLTQSPTQQQHQQGKLVHNLQLTNINGSEDDAIGDGLLTGIGVDVTIKTDSPIQLERTESLTFFPGQIERRRRKLPEIPKTKRCKWPSFKFVYAVCFILWFCGCFFQLPYY